MNTKIWLLWAASMVGCGVGEYFSKVYSLKPGWVPATVAIVGYVGTIVFWLPALREHKVLAVLSVVFSLGYVVTGVLIGTLFFGEQVTLKQWEGVGLAIVAAWLLS